MDDNYKNKCDCILPIGDDYRHITQKIRDLCHNCKCGETYDYDAINVLLDNETANNAPAAQTSSIVNSFRHLFSQLKAELSHQLSEDRETEDDDGQSQQKLLLTLLGRNYVDDFLGKQQERKSKSEYFKVCGKIDEMQIQTETKKREEILFHIEKANLTQADSGELNVREPIKLPIRSLDLEFIGTISIYPNSLHVLPRKTDISVQVNHENGSNNDEQIEFVSAAAIPSLLKNNNNNSSITTTESSNITSEMSAGQIEAEKVAWLFAHHGDRATVYNVNKAGMVSNFATRECSAHNMQSATNARARDAKKSPALKPSPKRKNYFQNLVEIVPKTKDNAIVAREVSFPSSFDTAQFFGEFPVNNSLGNSSNKAIIQEDEGESTLDQITPISTTFESN